MDNFNLIMEEIQRYRNIEIPKLVGKIRKQARIFRNFNPLIKSVISKSILKGEPWNVIAVDGSTDYTQLEGVGFAVASARAFQITLGKTAMSDKNDVKLFDTPASDVASIVSTTFMKSLEYSVALESAKSLEDNYKTLFLLDGAVTFPDTSVNNTKIPELTEAYRKFEKSSNSFFNYVREKENFYVIAVSKDARSAKYLRALQSNPAILSKIDKSDEFKNEISKILKKESWKERIALQFALRNNCKDKPCYLEPVDVSVPGIMHGEIPIEVLRKEGTICSYYLYPNASHALYLEIPRWNEPTLDDLLDIFNELCRVSPVTGYPYPLVYVDILTRMTKSLSTKLFSQLVYEIRNIAPDIASDIVASKMRELLH
ncbi:MAG: DNA double-strand break repair nuclease NurA [Candidatus Heimdallarchaeaceae archaeon]